MWVDRAESCKKYCLNVKPNAYSLPSQYVIVNMLICMFILGRIQTMVSIDLLNFFLIIPGKIRNIILMHMYVKPKRIANFQILLLQQNVMFKVMPGCDCPLANLVFENAKNDGQFHRIATGLLKINKEKKTFSIRV